MANEDESVTFSWCLRMIRCLVSGSMMKNMRGRVLLLVVEEKWKLGIKRLSILKKKNKYFFPLSVLREAFYVYLFCFFYFVYDEGGPMNW